MITGFLPQEILGTSIYEYIHSEDLNEFAEAHRLMLQLFSSGNITKVILHVSLVEKQVLNKPSIIFRHFFLYFRFFIPPIGE